MAPWTFPQRLQNEGDFSWRIFLLKGALVVHWLPCALSMALVVRAGESREEDEDE
jgi:hypothetical protein